MGVKDRVLRNVTNSVEYSVFQRGAPETMSTSVKLQHNSEGFINFPRPQCVTRTYRDASCASL